MYGQHPIHRGIPVIILGPPARRGAQFVAEPTDQPLYRIGQPSRIRRPPGAAIGGH